MRTILLLELKIRLLQTYGCYMSELYLSFKICHTLKLELTICQCCSDQVKFQSSVSFTCVQDMAFSEMFVTFGCWSLRLYTHQHASISMTFVNLPPESFYF
ncbi:hypothetical protein ABZP36_029586 [Zizania latifolia]